MCGFYNSIEPALAAVILGSWVLFAVSLFGAEVAARRWEARSPDAPHRKAVWIQSTTFLVCPFGRLSRALARDQHPSASAARLWAWAFRLGTGGFLGGAFVLWIFSRCL